MGQIETSLAGALFSGVQRRLLTLFYGQPDRSYYTNELLRLTATGRGGLQRELARLVTSGLVNATIVGNQKHYQANRAAPIFNELRGIVLKTFGLADVSPLVENDTECFSRNLHAAMQLGWNAQHQFSAGKLRSSGVQDSGWNTHFCCAARDTLFLFQCGPE